MDGEYHHDRPDDLYAVQESAHSLEVSKYSGLLLSSCQLQQWLHVG